MTTTTNSSLPQGRPSTVLGTPAPGETLAVDIAPGNVVQLSFNPEDASVSRSGDDLVFELDNGGSVTVNEFFSVDDSDALPQLVLPTGEEVPVTVAFADVNFDIETAAGPSAGRNEESSGAGEYVDDPGLLIDGISRLGSLGTIYWDRNTEIPEVYDAPEMPGGDLSLVGMTDLGGTIGLAGGVYEDGLPFQNMGDSGTFVPGQLIFTFKPSGTTVVEGIHISGFPAGAVIYFGDPSDPSTLRIVVEDPNQVIDFTEKDFKDGVYFTPPKDCDKDFTLNIDVDIKAESSGMTDTISDSTKVIVDAVADKPELGENLTAESDSSQHLADVTDTTKEYDDGYNENKSTVSAGENSGGATVTITVEATFGDYKDGSERHYLLIETHDHLKLNPDSLPDGYRYVGTIVIDGVEYHQIEVDNDIIADGEGSVSLPVEFETTGDSNEKSGQDETFELKAGAYGEEDVDPKGEINLDNNTAHTVTEDGKDLSTSVDVVNSTLTVKSGWASEGNNSSKHTNGDYAADHDSMDGGKGVDNESTNEDGAPIQIGLDPDSHEGSAEFITEVELTFSEGRGDLCINGEAVYDGMVYEDGNGVTYTFSVDPATGTVTISINGGQVTSLDELNMTFRPSEGSHDDSDVNMSYKVTVSNEAGATGKYEGETEIVIDAVADKPVDVGGAGVDYGEGQTSALPGQDVDLSFTATFPDTDGSETHTIFIRVDGNNGSATHGYGDKVIGGERIDELNGFGAGLDKDGDYLELAIPPLSEFVDGVYYCEELGITITYNGDGTYTVSDVHVTMPDRESLTDGDKSNGELNGSTGDTSLDFGCIGWAHENEDKAGSDGANNEHDTKNNDAFTSGNSTVTISTVGGGEKDFVLSGGAGFENDRPHNNRPADPNEPAGPDNNVVEDGGIPLNITWHFADGNEYVSEIRITVPLDRFGNPVGEIVYNGKTYQADENGVVRIPVDEEDAKDGLGNVVFVPKGGESGEIDLEVGATIKDAESGDSVDKDLGNISVDVDSVGNRSGEVTGEASYDGDNSAIASGESVTVVIKTTFTDNDGSERHYILVQQKPHWNGQYDTEYYDLDGDGNSEPYFKVPVPTAPPEGAPDDYPGDAHHLSMEDWNTLCETGTVTTSDGITITIPSDGKGGFDPSGEWKVEAEVTLDPPPLGEGTHSLGTGSLVEEHNIDHSTENRGDDYKDNNVAMRPGDEVSFDVNNTEGIRVDGEFVYEAGEQHKGGEQQNGVIHVGPSSKDDSFYGDLSVSIPSGHGDLHHNGTELKPGGGENPDGSYPATLVDKDGNEVTGKLTVTDEDGKLTVTFTPDDPNAPYSGIDLEVTLKPGDHSDTDIKISVDGNLVNDKSGQQTPGVGGSGEVVVDSVAQTPEDLDADVAEHESLKPGSETGVLVTITATFGDTEDGSESHFFLLEAKPGHSFTFTLNGKEYTIDVTSDWPTVIGPDGKMYYKIPATPDKNGNASLDVDVKVIPPYLGGESSDIKYGSMAEDKPSDSGETTYDNNIAFDVDNSFTIDVEVPSGGPIDVGVAYENNRPNANTGDDDEEYAKVTLPKDADEIRLDPGDGSIMLKNSDGSYTKLEPDDDGWVRVPPGQEDNIYFGVPEDYKDKDLSLGYEIDGGEHDGAKGSENVVVDAVAQPGTVDKIIIHTEDGCTHVGEGDVTITVEVSGLDDQDGSSDYYVLVEAKPGWECVPEAELVIIDGQAYFRVPVDPSQIGPDGKASVDITLKTPPAGSDGTLTEDLGIGTMVVDRPTDTGESTMDNNVSINVDGSVTIEKSVPETNLVLNVTEGYEDNLGSPAGITVSGVGNNDEVTELNFSVDASEGQFTYKGNPLFPNGYSDKNITITVKEENGNIVVTVKPTPPATGLTQQDLDDYLNDKLGVGPSEGNSSSDDIKVEWGYDVRDTNSGDTAGKHDQEHTVIIDAVAHKPEVKDYDVNYGGDKEAALPGDTVKVTAKVEFSNIEDETNFVLVQFTPGWEIHGITITINGVSIHFTADEIREMDLFYPNGSGDAYYKIPLEKDGTKLDPGVDEGKKYTVDVEVETKVPESGITGDTSGSLGVGGAAVDSYGDGETSLSNNVASDTENKDADGNGINIGVVDSTDLSASADDEGISEVQPGETAPSIGITITPEGGSNDVITKVILTPSDPDAGDFYYKGEKLIPGPDGKIVINDPDFDTSELTFQPNEGWNGKLDVGVEAEVEDSKSGAKGDSSFDADFSIEVAPAPTTPTGLEAKSEFSETDPGLWVLTLSASFADVDGSEEHFFLFTIPDGLTLDGEYFGLEPALGPNGEPGYWKLPVDPTDPSPSVELNFRADETWDGEGTVEFHAGASENNETAWADSPATGNEVSPADDGEFSYRYVLLDGDGDFSGMSDPLHVFGGAGDDTIIGGQGDDVLFGDAGNDVIHATAGDNVIAGGAGDDTLYGGTGQDTFFWDLGQFAGKEETRDVVHDFEYQKDLLHFDDLFDDLELTSVGGILNILSENKGWFSGNQMRLEGEACNLVAEFGENGVTVSLESDGAVQVIDIIFNAGAEGYRPPSDANQAAEILQYLISQGSV